MKMSRRKITFRTPRKTSKTPMKPSASRTRATGHGSDEPSREASLSSSKENILRYRQVLSDLRLKEESLVESYKRENEYLRSLKADILLYKKFIGFDIAEADEGYEVTHETSSNGVAKFLRFRLIPDEGSYIYKLIESRNIDLPDFLVDEISFDGSQIMKFFFKVMEASISRNG
jgi:hypothetical protein